MSGDWM